MESKQTGWFEKADHAIMKLFWVVSIVSGVCLLGIMVVAFVNVLGEKLLHNGIPGSTEIITYLHVPVVFMAAAYVTLDNGHTKIDLLANHLPKGVQKVLTTIGNIVAIAICGFVSYNGFLRTGELIARHTKSSTSGFGFPVWPFAALFSVGMILLAVSFAWAIVRQYADPNYEKKEGPGAPPVSEDENGGAQ
ncbi:MAG: TRAP transporter small permease [Eubacterium sp.]|nr:TRAP transporter small permease [Eubacterium sp.]